MIQQKEFKSVIAIVRIIDAKTEEVKREFSRTIDDATRRKWLEEKLSTSAMWAMLNGCYMEVINKDDDV